MNITARVQVGHYDPHNMDIDPKDLFNIYNGDIAEYLMDTGDIQEEWALINVTITKENTNA